MFRIFTPGPSTTITTTTASQSAGPFASSVIRVANTGTAALVCALGPGAQTAVAGKGFAMPPNAVEYFEASPAGTWEFACLTGTGGNVVTVTEMV